MAYTRSEISARYNARHPDRVKARHDAYRKTHQEEVAKLNKEWRASHRDQVNQNKMESYYKNREEINARRNRKYWEHRDENVAKSLEYAKNHREEACARARKYNQDHREEIRIKQHEKYIANPDIGKARSRAWREENIELAREHGRERYAMNRQNPDFVEQQRERARDSYDPEARRNQHYQRLYGITLDEYNAMFSEQKGMCPICGRHQTEVKKLFHVDHDHETGEVRGLLCMNCNAALGNFRDDIELLERAIQYLGGYSH